MGGNDIYKVDPYISNSSGKINEYRILYILNINHIKLSYVCTIFYCKRAKKISDLMCAEM